jgi:hypothetical protein
MASFIQGILRLLFYNRYSLVITGIMAPIKMLKKSDEAGEGSNPNLNVLYDTTPHAVDAIQ